MIMKMLSFYPNDYMPKVKFIFCLCRFNCTVSFSIAVKTDDSLFLLATSYYRNGQLDHAYHVLKETPSTTPQCRYLFGSCAYALERYFF